MKGWTEHDVRNISKKPGFRATQQAGAGVLGQQTSAGEELLAMFIDVEELPKPEREFRFDEERKWRFDFAWPEQLLAVEVEGITHDGGRHQRRGGFEKDCEKYEAAMLKGWRVYRVTPSRIKSGRAVQVIRELLEQ